VTISEVKITRQGEYAHFDYADTRMGGLSANVGPGIRKMTAADLVRWHNDFVRSRQKLARTYKHVAVEIVGRPQLKYSEECGLWTSRGDVLRCASATAPDDAGEPVIEIDDTDLSLREFGELLSTWEGWGMRIVFVPEGELHKTPVVKVAAGKKGR
jgi:hypothetical protein